MEFLDVSHDPLLVAFACAVAFVAGFTGLTLTRSLSDKSERQRKIAITLAAISLGGGIWSMHFVAMLGLQLPILFYYDAAITLASALLAILIVGMALIVLHFLERTTMAILASGALVGVGVLAMHYVGMAGLKLCRAVYTLPGVALSSVAAILLCMLAVWVAYQRRNNRNILLATLCFGVAVASVHFLAMAGTGFVQVPGSSDFGPTMSNEVLAIGVILSSFVIFGACIWVSTTYLTGGGSGGGEEFGVEPVEEPIAAAPSDVIALQIPCERDSRKIFVSPGEVAFVRADGHYTQIYTPRDRLFCAWPITEATKRLLPAGFLQTHRSYLVNPSQVSRFERSKDKGRCTFKEADLPPVPVSRSKLKDIQRTFSDTSGATGAL
ncbi:MAG: MHYT domain-containing protein [Pseudomonadota bacterium]